MKNYSHLFFDCDGVILNSNKIKTEGFYKIALEFGETNAQKLVDYHIKHGGISRYKKIKFFQEVILKNNDQNLYKRLVEDYGNIVKNYLLETEISDGIFKIRDIFPDAKLVVISGSDQKELRWLFNKLKINHIFDLGIYGSPRSKNEILDDLFTEISNFDSGIFFGDSKYDYEVSKLYKLDFAFISDWTELSNWNTFIKENNIDSYANILEFLKFKQIKPSKY
jgi:phosphoglycolate phosphatase-like HAD superfamily hydrolase